MIDKTIKNNSVKSIIAPHDISYDFINKLENLYGEKAIKFSCLKSEDDFKRKILIIDSIGVLKYLYAYGSISYVGGGMSNKGLHNILEPAVFSCPVIIGFNYQGYIEAEELIELGGVYSVKDSEEFYETFSWLNNSEKERKKAGLANINYILKKVERNSIIFQSLTKYLQ